MCLISLSINYLKAELLCFIYFVAMRTVYGACHIRDIKLTEVLTVFFPHLTLSLFPAKMHRFPLPAI